MNNREALEDLYYELVDRGVDLWSVLCAMDEYGGLPGFLVSIGEGDLANGFMRPYSYKKSLKILVSGDSKVALKNLRGIGKQLGFSKNRFDFVLGYEEGTHYDYEKLKYTETYGLAIMGAVGHSTHGRGNYSSIIEAMKWMDCYPNVVEARTLEGSLKITCTSFRDALIEAVDKGLVEPDNWEDYNSNFGSTGNVA